MPCILPKNWKCCLTCTYWCGERKVHDGERYASAERCDVRGGCGKQGSWSSNMEASHSACSDWKPWSALRD